MTSPKSHVRVSAIVPAAGLSRRMGRTKQTLRLDGSTLAATVVMTLLESRVDAVVVVTRSELVDRLELPRDPRVDVAINDDAESEMIDSIRVGLKACAAKAPQPDGILVVPGDMPRIERVAYRTAIDAFAVDPTRIVIATHQGRRGHPMIFPFSMRAGIDRQADNPDDLRDGLRSLARVYADLVREVEVDDPGTLTDVDTPADLENC